MKLESKNKKWYIICCILLLFIITNPSITAFKAYRGSETYTGLRRPANLFIYSIYRDGSEKYIGFFGNFWHVRHSDAFYYSHEDSVKHGLINDPFSKYGGKEIDTTKDTTNWSKYQIK